MCDMHLVIFLVKKYKAEYRFSTGIYCLRVRRKVRPNGGDWFNKWGGVAHGWLGDHQSPFPNVPNLMHPKRRF